MSVIVWNRRSQNQAVSEDKFTVGTEHGRVELVRYSLAWNVWFTTGPGESTIIAEGIDRMADAQKIANEFVGAA